MLLTHQKGSSFIELLIGIGVGLIVLAGIVYFLSRISSYATKNLKTVRLEYEIQTALDLMTHDIRRAGFSANVSGALATGVNSNPFMVLVLVILSRLLAVAFYLLMILTKMGRYLH